MLTAFDVLGVPRDITRADLRTHWRNLASKHHPDKGGSPEVFCMLKKAYDKADLVLKARDECCYTCDGRGVVEQDNLTLPCPKCKITRVSKK